MNGEKPPIPPSETNEESKNPAPSDSANTGSEQQGSEPAETAAGLGPDAPTTETDNDSQESTSETAPAASPVATATMPRYKCHKEVQAAKILGIGPQEPDGSCLLSLDGGLAVTVNDEFMKSKKPEPGGYLVEYSDGYRSFSPAEPFEQGYTKVPENGVVV